MNEKRLAEYCGVCVHEPNPYRGVFDCKLCGEFVKSGKPHVSFDFTTPDGWQLVADKIKEKGGWYSLYTFLMPKFGVAKRAIAGCHFHELPPAEKSAIVDEWLEEKADAN